MPGTWRAETRRFGVAEFGNPWHDEIGRFAPKGSGTNVGDGVIPVSEFPEGDVTVKKESKPGSLRRKIEDEIDIFLRGRPRLRDSDIKLLTDSIGVLMSDEDLHPPSREIPSEAKLKHVSSAEVDDFPAEVERVLRETMQGLHDVPTETVREKIKRKVGELVDTLLDTGPPDETSAPLPWLREPK